MLTYLLLITSIPLLHWAFHTLGIYDGVHDFLAGFCPCELSS